MAKRKARSVWVFWEKDRGLSPGNCITKRPPADCMVGGSWCGYVEFREVLPKKGKVTRAKK